MNKLTLVTFNCFSLPFLVKGKRQRSEKMINGLLAIKPDIICLQELILGETVTWLTARLRENGYHYFTHPGKLINKGGLLIASLFPIRKADFYSYRKQGNPLSFQLTDRFLHKGFQKTVLAKGKTEITLFNNHFVCLYKTSSKNRLALKKQLSELVKAVKKENRLVIVCGDFNFSPGHEFYQYFTKRTGLVDPFLADEVTVSPTNSCCRDFSIHRSYGKLDYIFLPSFTRVLSKRILFKAPVKIKNKKTHLSDHFGLFTEITF